jgi:hypothetical protein
MAKLTKYIKNPYTNKSLFVLKLIPLMNSIIMKSFK